METINVGKMVNTHGIKGEVRLLSDFPYKDIVFQPGNKVYVGANQVPVTIERYRKHKNFDMLTFQEFQNINDCLPFVGYPVYANRDQFDEDCIIEEELIGYQVQMDTQTIGIVTAILKNPANNLLVIQSQEKEYLVPNIDEFIEEINQKEKTIHIKYHKGLIE